MSAARIALLCFELVLDAADVEVEDGDEEDEVVDVARPLYSARINSDAFSARP